MSTVNVFLLGIVAGILLSNLLHWAAGVSAHRKAKR